VIFLCGFGCSSSKPAPDPLAGFRIYVNHDPDQTVTKDYQDYIQTLSPEERRRLGPIQFFEDGTGQHAIDIVIGINGRLWRHVLIYDKDDKRIKTIKYATGYYAS
jgi:hypothetical protein